VITVKTKQWKGSLGGRRSRSNAPIYLLETEIKETVQEGQ
jgi:hypothetical protein